MKLAGRVWDSLLPWERLSLLRHCKTIMTESIKQHESTLRWNELWPLRQDELLEIDFCAILGRDVQP